MEDKYTVNKTFPEVEQKIESIKKKISEAEASYSAICAEWNEQIRLIKEQNERKLNSYVPEEELELRTKIEEAVGQRINEMVENKKTILDAKSKCVEKLSSESEESIEVVVSEVRELDGRIAEINELLSKLAEERLSNIELAESRIDSFKAAKREELEAEYPERPERPDIFNLLEKELKEAEAEKKALAYREWCIEQIEAGASITSEELSEFVQIEILSVLDKENYISLNEISEKIEEKGYNIDNQYIVRQLRQMQITDVPLIERKEIKRSAYYRKK